MCPLRCQYNWYKKKLVEVCGLPLIHDKTVDEWGTADFRELLTGPPAFSLRQTLLFTAGCIVSRPEVVVAGFGVAFFAGPESGLLDLVP
jgi:hypothetical protein